MELTFEKTKYNFTDNIKKIIESLIIVICSNLSLSFVGITVLFKFLNLKMSLKCFLEIYVVTYLMMQNIRF